MGKIYVRKLPHFFYYSEKVGYFYVKRNVSREGTAV